MKKFQKRKEDFTCEKCLFFVKGNGFTNHCPQCFFSKHVDIFPGDRKDECDGLMEVLEIERKNKKYIISHQCQKCQKISKDFFREDFDNFEAFLKIQETINQKKETK